MQRDTDNLIYDPAKTPPLQVINYDSLHAEVVFKQSTNPTNHPDSPGISSTRSVKLLGINSKSHEGMDFSSVKDLNEGMVFEGMVQYAPEEPPHQGSPKEAPSHKPISNSVLSGDKDYVWSFQRDNNVLDKLNHHPEVLQRTGRSSCMDFHASSNLLC